MGPGSFFIGVATQKSQTSKFDDICFVSCFKKLSLGFSVVVVHPNIFLEKMTQFFL